MVGKKPKLTEEELKILSQVLFNTKWAGQEWQRIVSPLINKLAKLIDAEQNGSKA